MKRLKTVVSGDSRYAKSLSVMTMRPNGKNVEDSMKEMEDSLEEIKESGVSGGGVTEISLNEKGELIVTVSGKEAEDGSEGGN